MQVGKLKEYIVQYGDKMKHTVKSMKPRMLTAHFESCLEYHKVLVKKKGDQRRVIIGLRPKTDLELQPDLLAESQQ